MRNPLRATLQLAKKHDDKMPVGGSLRAVAAASRLSMGALHAELGALRASLADLAATLRTLPDDAEGAAFKQVSALCMFRTRPFALPQMCSVELRETANLSC